KADVDSDPAYEPDTEVIIDGAFAESKFRSAPYFDIQIDGITLLDTAF
ncbi:MAG: BMP family ABC transporter substrate-binding protein, partial [Lachnospiraceae bacterium]|nr:BMP family ABC transporter substrate-binding protein [Lachnospiraceae bacterium]